CATVPVLHSFPPRRSSDLVAATVTAPATVVSPTSTAAAGDTGGEAKGRNSFHGYSRSPVPRETLTPEDVLPRPPGSPAAGGEVRSEEHTSELQSRENLVCR